MKQYSHIIAWFFASVAFTLHAQKITFEIADEYKSIGVYDSWEDSPFRTGEIANPSAYMGITENPFYMDSRDTDNGTGIANNNSPHVLAIQRSRFGSNIFGARVDLKDTLRLGKQTKYVHVMLYKPQGENGSTMLVGLGKRKNWPYQSPEAEQFWARSSKSYVSGMWNDLVFPISTNENVEIHSLVIVPDLASPHNRTTDFVAYIDNIKVDDDPEPRLQQSNYPVNFDIEQEIIRSDRQLTSATFNITDETTQSFEIEPSKVYNDFTESQCIKASPGSDVSVVLTYKGAWMSGYVYVDWNNNGKLTPVIQENKPTEKSELVSYTHLNGFNSLGENSNGNDVSESGIVCPTFKIPESTIPDIYRMRLKVDWDSDDAGGNTSSENKLVNNGGSIIDVLLNVHSDSVNISANQLNGDVMTAEGKALSEKRIKFAQDFKVKAEPAPGFTYTGIVIQHGYNLDGPQYVRDNRQYSIDVIPATSFNSDDEYIIPASIVDGDIHIEGLFTPDTTGILPTYLNQKNNNEFYSIQGIRLKSAPAKGIYLENGKKKLKP